MVWCKKCDEQYSEKRAQLGYDTCLECGEQDAQLEIQRKSKCKSQLYNKGAYMYVYSRSDIKGIFKQN